MRAILRWSTDIAARLGVDLTDESAELRCRDRRPGQQVRATPGSDEEGFGVGESRYAPGDCSFFWGVLDAEDYRTVSVVQRVTG